MEAYLLADIWSAWTGQPHPARETFQERTVDLLRTERIKGWQARKEQREAEAAEELAQSRTIDVVAPDDEEGGG